MAATEPTLDPASPHARLPTFELCFDVDDDVDPTWVTIYSDVVEDLSTHWISISAWATVPLDEVA